jgi:hypothetical protein
MTQDANGAVLAPSTVRLHIFGRNMHVRCEAKEAHALLLCRASADLRISALLDLLAEHDNETPDEQANIRRTLSEILENSPVLLPNA